jgi:F420-non-reducing hydrogenase iron-sulfur subunit
MSNIGVATAPSNNGTDSFAKGQGTACCVVAFICENCARTGLVPTSGFRRRPTTPDFGWPFSVNEVVVPCAGRLQPEHFLKAFEDGADAIGVICCEEGNCHHLEGNRRCNRRLEHVNGLLEQIGLGGNRLKIFYLPGSANEDMALGASIGLESAIDPSISQKIAAVRDAFVTHVATIPMNPLRKPALPEESPYELDDNDESDD